MQHKSIVLSKIKWYIKINLGKNNIKKRRNKMKNNKGKITKKNKFEKQMKTGKTWK